MTTSWEQDGPTVFSRRTALKWGAALAVVAAGASTVGWSPANAFAAPGDQPSTVPVLFGTPTDLAAARTEQAWTRESDGTVYTFDKTGRAWTLSEQQDWATILGYGTAILARWGSPSGSTKVVMIFGSAPPSTPTSTATATATATSTAASTATSTASTSPQPSSTSPYSSSAAASSTGPPTVPIDPRKVPGGQQPVPPNTASNAGSSDLAYTGFDVLGWTVGGAAAIGLGGLFAFRKRRMDQRSSE